MAIPKTIFWVVSLATLNINRSLRWDLNLALILPRNLDFVVVYAPSYPAPAMEPALIAIHRHSWHCDSPDAKLWVLIFFPCPLQRQHLHLWLLPGWPLIKASSLTLWLTPVLFVMTAVALVQNQPSGDRLVLLDTIFFQLSGIYCWTGNNSVCKYILHDIQAITSVGNAVVPSQFP